MSSPARGSAPTPGDDGPRVAYIMSRFPLLTETFILREMLELERQGMALAIFPLLRERPSVRHDEVGQLAAPVHYTPFLSRSIIKANFVFMRRDIRRYFGLLWSVLKSNWGSVNLCVGALGIFPKSVYFARQVELCGIRHVHAHYATHPALAAYIISELTDVSFSFTVHAHDIFLQQQMLAEKVRRALFVVAISQFNKAYLLRYAPGKAADSIKIVHCGIEIENYGHRQGPPPAHDGAVCAVCVGSLQPYKGIKYLVLACAEVVRHIPGFRCTIIGEGADRPELEALIAELGLQKTVRLAGGTPQHEVAALLGSAEIFVLPSVVAPSGQMEGIPVALMEAMASRLPVVSTRLSGIPELVEDGQSGLLVPPADQVALADAIISLCADAELRRTMGERGRQKVAMEFTLKENVARLRSLFEAAVHDSGKGIKRETPA